MLNRIIFSLFIQLINTQVLTAQDYHIKHILPALIAETSIVVRNDQTTFTITKDLEATEERIYAITFFKEPADHYFYFGNTDNSFQKIKGLSGKIFDAQGKLIRMSEKSDLIKDGGGASYEFSDNRSKFIFLKHSQYPFTLEFTIKIEHSSFFHFPDWTIQVEGVSVQQTSYTIKAPVSVTYKWRAERIEITPQITENEGINTWRAQTTQLCAIPREKHSKHQENRYKYCHFNPDQVKYGNHLYKTSNWEEYGAFSYMLNRDRDILSVEMQRNVLNLIKDAKSEIEKIDILYKYLQTNHRYVSVQIGVGAFQTFPASFVEQKKYGDCKALSNYMLSLLKAAGISSNLVLIGAADGNNLDLNTEICQPDFNHMLVYIPSQQLWLECVSSNHPPGYLGDFSGDRKALIVQEKGSKLVHTPIYGDKENGIKSHLHLQLTGVQGDATLRYQAKHLGTNSDIWYQYAELSDEKTLQDYFLRNAKLSASSISPITILINKKQPEAEISVELEAKYATKSGRRLLIPIHKLHQFEESLPLDTLRTQSINIQAAYTWLDTITIHLPNGTEIEATPDPQNIITIYGSYKKNYKTISPQVVQCTRELIKYPIDAPASEYAAVRDWYQKVRTADQDKLVAVITKSP
jgi:Domain of Unknown Function with PDB structure (DUF3857)